MARASSSAGDVDVAAAAQGQSEFGVGLQGLLVVIVRRGQVSLADLGLAAR